MSERINIWRRPDCELPSGKLCNACCVLPNIELSGFVVSVAKPENSPCPYLTDDSGKEGKGCSLHSRGKPETCLSWHCSNLKGSDKIIYIAQGLSLGLVDEADAVTAAGESGKSMLIDMARRLSKITVQKELVTRDLDEP